MEKEFIKEQIYVSVTVQAQLPKTFGRELISSAMYVQESVWKYSKTHKLESGSEVKGT